MENNGLSHWPAYFAENLILGSELSSIGIATLWTPREHFAKKIPTELFRVIGQLYSNDGINPMIRNIWANPTIRTIVLCGQDRIGSADALSFLLKNGVNEKRQVIGKEEVQVEKEIPLEAIEQFREAITLLDLRGVLNPKDLTTQLERITQDTTPWAEPQVFPEPEISSDWFPSEGSAFEYRGATVVDVWLKMLHGIMRFSEQKMSNHTDGTQRELLNLTAVVTDEDPDDIHFAEYFPFTPEHFEGYKPQVLTAEPIPSLSYTYGMRLRNYNGINQVEEIIAKLKDKPWSRQAVGVLWDVQKDHESSNPPCLNVIHAVIQYEKLHLTCYLRSNDIYRAWPENALAFRAMQKEIADGVGVEMGILTTISGSAHIYEENYAQVQNILNEYYPDVPCEQDPRGNYVIQVKDTSIHVIHMSPSGKKIGQYQGKTAMNIFNQIARDEGVKVRIHAFDLGAELQKAEIALKLGIEYTQDRPLPYKDIAHKMSSEE